MVHQPKTPALLMFGALPQQQCPVLGMPQGGLLTWRAVDLLVSAAECTVIVAAVGLKLPAVGSCFQHMPAMHTGVLHLVLQRPHGPLQPSRLPPGVGALGMPPGSYSMRWQTAGMNPGRVQQRSHTRVTHPHRHTHTHTLRWGRGDLPAAHGGGICRTKGLLDIWWCAACVRALALWERAGCCMARGQGGWGVTECQLLRCWVSGLGAGRLLPCHGVSPVPHCCADAAPHLVLAFVAGAPHQLHCW